MLIIELNDASAQMTKENQKVNESWLAWFGTGIKMVLNKMFGAKTENMQFKGTKLQLENMAKTIGKEYLYIKDVAKYGFDAPQTYKSKYELLSAVSKFERITGIKWPFK